MRSDLRCSIPRLGLRHRSAEVHPGAMLARTALLTLLASRSSALLVGVPPHHQFAAGRCPSVALSEVEQGVVIPRHQSHGAADACHMLGEEGEHGHICDTESCVEGEVFLCAEPPSEEDGCEIQCELQPGMTMHGKPVWACTKRPVAARSAVAARSEVAMAADGRVNVGDLGLSVSDLEEALPEELLGSVQTSGYESTSRTSSDQGCEWEETADELDVTLTIPGLRGQPSMAVAVDFDTSTCTVTVFGRQVWSCIMRGEIDPSQSSMEALDGVGALPIVRLSVRKQPGAKRWGGFIKDIGEDSLLQ